MDVLFWVHFQSSSGLSSSTLTCVEIENGSRSVTESFKDLQSHSKAAKKLRHVAPLRLFTTVCESAKVSSLTGLDLRILQIFRDPNHAVNGRNPPVNMWVIPFTRFYTSQVVQEFFHQQYHYHNYPIEKIKEVTMLASSRIFGISQGKCELTRGNALWARSASIECPAFGKVAQKRRLKTLSWHMMSLQLWYDPWRLHFGT